MLTGFQQLESRRMMTAVPTTIELAPSSQVVARHTPHTIAVRFADADGVEDISVADFQVYNHGPDDDSARCFVRYDAQRDVLSLWNDQSTSFGQVGAPGSSGSISNRDCTVSAASTTVTRLDANTLEIELELTFRSMFTEQHDVWLRAFDVGGQSSLAAVRGSITFVSPIGDVNQDDVVDFADFLILSNNFGATVEAKTNGDLDGDGIVSFTDFLILSHHFGENE